MKSKILWILAILCLGIVIQGYPKGDPFHVIKGPYLGQKPPGDQREIFAPGIVSTGFNEHGVSFTPDGKEIFFRLLGPPHGVILTMKEDDGVWSMPRVAPFSGTYDGKCCLSPDGNTLLISSGSPPSGQGPVLSYWTIWMIKRTKTGWGKPENLSHLKGAYPTISNNKTIYYYARAKNGKGDIFKSVFEKGKYSNPILVGPPISTEYWENDPYIAPNESFLIFQSDRPGTLGEGDLFISFRLENGRWSNPVNLGEGVNTSESGEACPWVTPDGKYLFFSSMKYDYQRYSEKPLDLKTKTQVLNSPGYGSEDVFWVDAGIIDELKPQDIYPARSRDSENSTMESGTVTDIDGNVYRTVKIGNQIWMAENLKVTRYRDSTPVPNVYDKEKWQHATGGAYCMVNNDSIQYKNTYGLLYNFYAVDNKRGLAPEGWHIPTESECIELINHLGGKDTAGGKIKDNSTGLWKNKNSEATNESGFSALPASGRGRLGYPGDVGYYTTWWSSTSCDSMYAWHWGLYPDKPGIRSNPGHKASGFSVRCVKDEQAGF